MTVYVLGAGASLNAGYPLANQLGSWLLDWAQMPDANPLASGCVKELAGLYGELTDLERILTELADCPNDCLAATLTRMHRGLLLTHLRVAITELFRGSRNHSAYLYERLADEKIKAGDVILTFNYDVACERALKRAGLWEIGDGYGFPLEGVSLPKSPVTVLKLHGSVNWLESAFGGSSGFFQGGPFAFGARPVIPSWEVQSFGYQHTVFDPEARTILGAMPALIMPTMNKRFYEVTSGGRELEDFWEGLWREAELALKSASEVVIIGYSMAAADRRARELMLNNAGQTIDLKVFCGEASAAIGEQFSASGHLNFHSYGRGFFEDFLAT